MKPYPRTPVSTLDDVQDIMRFITRERDADIINWNNLSQIFVGGRKVGKVPSSSNDVDPTDKVGDLNYDADYLYILINDAGTAEWRRTALSSW